MQSKRDFWVSVVGQDWYDFYSELWESGYMENVMSYITERYASATVYPNKKDLFKPFKLTSPKEIKVIILGEDPYSDGSATGLAYANFESKITVSPTLGKIRDAVEKSAYDGLNIVFDITLEEWAEQGVLLLNTSLTIEKFATDSHYKVWNSFISNITQKLCEKINGLHVCLWGNKALEYKKLIPTTAYIYESVSPSYAFEKKIEWECNHFKKINEMIFKQNGKEEIIAW